MIILIGGVSCSGKTVMAQRLLEKYRIPYLSLDHLKMGLVRGTENCGFTPFDSDDFISQKLWPIVRSIIMTAVENNQSLIIEGCYLPPRELCSLPPEYAKEVRELYIIFSESYIRNNFESGILLHAGDIETRGEEDRPLEWFIKAHSQMRVQCLKYGAQFCEICNDYETDIAAGYAMLNARV